MPPSMTANIDSSSPPGGYLEVHGLSNHTRVREMMKVGI